MFQASISSNFLQSNVCLVKKAHDLILIRKDTLRASFTQITKPVRSKGVASSYQYPDID